MRKTLRSLVVCLVLSLMAAWPSFGVFGIGDIVFDPTNYLNAIEQLVQAQAQVNQLIQTYRMVQNQYDHMRRMAQMVPVSMASRYRSPLMPLRTTSAANAYGTSGGWVAGINSGLGVPDGYRRATELLGTYGPAMSQVPADQAARVKSSYATVELTDGANLYSLQTIGDLRGRAEILDNAIRNLESDSLSADPAMNTEIAVLNKINAANMLNVRNTQDSNRLLIALAEQQSIAAKRQRDAEAAAVNQHIQFVSQGRATLASHTADASHAMQSWRLP